MKTYLKQIKIRPLITGLLSFLPGVTTIGQYAKRAIGGTTQKRPLDWGLNVLKQRLVEADQNQSFVDGKVYLEVAPGDNFSGPIAALALGARESIGIDAFDYTDFSSNNQILEKLKDRLSLSTTRYQDIQREISSFEKARASDRLHYHAPWHEDHIPALKVDLATSISTLEHVDDPARLYQALFNWLKPGALLVNKIDFSSHGTTKDWFGHYLMPNSLWALIEGKKNHLNRWTETQHIKTAEKVGFKLKKRLGYEGDIPAPSPFQDIPRAATHIWVKPQE